MTKSPVPLATEEDSRGCVAEIDLAAIQKNFEFTQRKSGEHPAICTVKANGYGHGAVPVARALREAGAFGFGVVTLEEAQQLRDANVQGPILLVGCASWWREPERLLELNATPIIASVEEIVALERLGSERGQQIEVHLGIDTGLAREGFYIGTKSSFDVGEIVDALAKTKFVVVRGAMTHFRNADLAEETQSNDQVDFFSSAIGALRARGVLIDVAHFSNSAASLRNLKLSNEVPDDVVLWTRPGICLYGITPYPDGRLRSELQPAMAWRAPIVARKRVPAGTKVSYGGTFVTTRETELAVVGVGYGDGYPRHLSNAGAVMVADSRANILGRVCMDLTVVDVTDAQETKGKDACGIGEMVWLLGGPSTKALDAWEVANAAGTIGYEIVVRVSQRVPRVYHGAPTL